MSPIVAFALCSFASGFATRLADPIVLPVAHEFAISTTSAALLNVGFAFPYAAAQPFLGPLGDRLGKDRCIEACIVGLALSLLAGVFASTFGLLLTTRVVAGLFAAGLTPLVLASMGDRYELHERQVMIGRMLFAIIGGQMLGSAVSGLANDAWGWRSPLAIAAIIGVVAAALSIAAFRTGKPTVNASASTAEPRRSILQVYGSILAHRKALWLYGCVLVEGALFSAPYPYMGQLLVQHTGTSGHEAARQTGLVLGAAGIGGLVYALTVRLLMKHLGPARMTLAGSAMSGICVAALAFATSWWVCLAAMGVGGLAFFMMHNSLQTQATELAPANRASAVALFACGYFGGQSLGPLYFGALSSHVGFTTTLLGIAVFWVVLGQLAARKVMRR